VISIILVKDDVTVSVPSVREKKKSVDSSSPYAGSIYLPKYLGSMNLHFDNRIYRGGIHAAPIIYIFVCNKYGHESRLPAVGRDTGT